MLKPFEDWEGGIPPFSWKRYLAFDVGGATANAMEWAAQDPKTLSLVFYHELHKITTDMRALAAEALPHMKSEGRDYDFTAKVGDYENLVALSDMAKYGIHFDNAVKQNKIKSVHRLQAYLHPNPKRPFPMWHPLAGQLGAPLMFILPQCTHLIEELPQQKWKADTSGNDVKDELDRSVKHDAVDCALYITRICPAPADIPVIKLTENEKQLSLQSRLYWEDIRRNEAKKKQSAIAQRKRYNPDHGGTDWSTSLPPHLQSLLQ